MKEQIDGDGCVANMGWLQRIGVAGFAFFLAKGLVWVVAMVWLAH